MKQSCIKFSSIYSSVTQRTEMFIHNIFCRNIDIVKIFKRVRNEPRRSADVNLTVLVRNQTVQSWWCIVTPSLKMEWIILSSICIHGSLIINPQNYYQKAPELLLNAEGCLSGVNNQKFMFCEWHEEWNLIGKFKILLLIFKVC